MKELYKYCAQKESSNVQACPWQEHRTNQIKNCCNGDTGIFYEKFTKLCNNCNYMSGISDQPINK